MLLVGAASIQCASDWCVVEQVSHVGRAANQEIADTRRLISSSPKLKGKLNHRQLAAMDHFIKHSHVIYRIQEHQNSNQVTYETARTDLLDLVDLGLLDKRREGKSFVFHLPQKVREKLAGKSAA
jgi:Fic family protein